MALQHAYDVIHYVFKYGEEPERGRGDTVPGRRSEWVEKEAEEVSDEQDFELVEARASKRLAKREL